MNILSVISLLFLFTPFQQTDPAPVDQSVSSSVKSATVYLSGAQVTRTGRLQLAAGSNTIIFDNLSSLFSEQSVQLSTDKTITILSLRKNISAENQGSAKLDSLEQKKKEIETIIKRKQAEETVLQRELEILLANKDLRGENQKISALEIKQAMEYFREKLNEIETSRIDVVDTIQEANGNLNKVTNQINEIQREQRMRSGQIIAEIQSPRSQRINFDISYFMSNAGWYPSYDVRVDGIDQPLGLTYKANIYQNSGIDWENVKLSISSAQPLSSTNIPTLQPVYLGFEMPRPQQSFRDREEMSAKQSLDEVVVTGYGNEMPAAPSVTVNQNQTSFSFTIDTPYTISGDGRSKTVNVQDHSLPATYRYFAAPRINETAFLTAQLTDWEDLNLLNGEMNLYFEQTFVGQSQLQARTPGDTLQFSLGKDEGVIIERNRLKEFTEKNFFGNKVTETRAWELVVRNAKNKSIGLTLVDQVPISTNEDIEIDLEERSGADFNRTSGKLNWELTIEPGDTQKRVFRYKVEYPSGKQLQRH